MSFRRAAEAAQIRWKRATALLPDDARTSAPMLNPENTGGHDGGDWEFCLPIRFAKHNLLPAARERMLQTFGADDIAWQAGVTVPSNHLCSSQVQLANFVGPLLDEPDRVRTLFSVGLPILTMNPWNDGSVVRFEWVGERDYLHEKSLGARRQRGAFATSADLALRYTALDGSIEIALVEWKYVERPDGRERRRNWARLKALHRPRLHAPGGFITTDMCDDDELFVEPLYQLLRLSLLAQEMEHAQEDGAERVRVVLVLPDANLQWRAWIPSRLLCHGKSVEDVWAALQRHNDRFSVIATEAFNPELLDPDVALRYGHLWASPQARRV